MQASTTKPATIFLQPISIDSKFLKQFMFQIAFYRNDKSTKLQPIKRTQPDNQITFNQKDHLLKLHTTLAHSEQYDKLQSKMFYIQVAFKIDGVKSSIEKQVDLAEFYKKGNDVHTMKILDKPETLLKFKIHVNIKQDKQKRQNEQKWQVTKDEPRPAVNLIKERNSGKSLSKPPLAGNKSMKIIRFQDTIQHQRQEYEMNEGLGRDKMKSMKNLTLMKDTQDKFGGKDVKQSVTNIQTTIQNQVQKKFKQLLKLQNKYTELQSKHKDMNLKFKKLNQKYNALVIEKEKQALNRESQSLAENETKKQKQKYEQLQKEFKKIKDQQQQHNKRLQSKQSQIKALKSQIKSLQQINRKNESKIKELKEQSQHFEDLLLEMETKNKTSTPSLEDSIKPYKERIRILQRQVEDLNEEKNFAQKQSRNLQDETIQLRQKIKALNEQNLKSMEQVSSKDYDIEKLNKKIKDLQAQLNNAQMKSNKNTSMGSEDQQQEEEYQKRGNMFKSQKIIGSSKSPSLTQLKSENSDLKLKLQITQKNLENKQALLKKFDSFSKEGRKEIEEELQKVKKQNQKLREKLESGVNSNGLGGLESRMELEKVKKDLEYKTKSEKQLLIDKSQLQSRNKALQEDVVKSKESIANILNVIHEFGDQGLIEEATSFLG